MRLKAVLPSLAIFLAGSVFGAIQTPSVPNKAFDVREANGIVDQGTTYPAAQTKFYQDYADNNNWANANPQPTKKKFALDGIKQFMKDQSVNARNKVAQAAVVAPDTSDLP